MFSFLRKILPSRNQRLLRTWAPLVQQINALEPQMRDTTNGRFLEMAQVWRDQIKQGTKLDDLLVPVFAATREVARRRVNMRHFDVQLVGGIALHQGKISEMATGEGKTLVATLTATLNAISGEGTHIVTVNDYLAQRDCQWMGEVYRGLGFEVSSLFSNMKTENRRAAYRADITYGTNSEFGFDYLRDNMAVNPVEKMQRKLSYAIVDEVDSILIDEARTPLIISGVVEDFPDRYQKIDQLAAQLRPGTGEDDLGDFSIDEKGKRAHLTEEGQDKAEHLLLEAKLMQGGLFDPENSVWLHHLDAGLRARFLYQKDVDYVIADQKVHIVDVFTGRIMPGRRWSQGLHQAIEAKEGVPIHPESQTLATVTLQNYFRMYDKLSGMTGTASTEAPEFMQIYGVEVVTIPTHQPNVRIDYPDRVFLTLEEKYAAIADEVQECYQENRPVLLGTVSIEVSELLSHHLTKLKIKHMVLNAKQHDKESFIVANAGKSSSVTIATNMAGRGTDIVLGGSLTEMLKDKEDPTEIAEITKKWQSDHDLVVSLGGLHIVGSERHESRRIDNQLRGRCARQGDPGSTRFYLSLEDNLMRIFASDTVAKLMRRMGLGDGESIEHNLLSRAIINAQRKVETHNFEIRKNLLDYDNVVNQQRIFIYEQREQLFDDSDLVALAHAKVKETSAKLVALHAPKESFFNPRCLPILEEDLKRRFHILFDSEAFKQEHPSNQYDNLLRVVEELMQQRLSENIERLGEELTKRLFSQVMMQTLDRCWREHLATIDYIKQGIHLRSYAQKQPIQEFKREAFNAFFLMTDKYRDEVCAFLLRPIDRVSQTPPLEQPKPISDIQSQHADASSASLAEILSPEVNAVQNQPVASGTGLATSTTARVAKLGRNQPCHCGSGRKYKHCHGKA